NSTTPSPATRAVLPPGGRSAPSMRLLGAGDGRTFFSLPVAASHHARVPSWLHTRMSLPSEPKPACMTQPCSDLSVPAATWALGGAAGPAVFGPPAAGPSDTSSTLPGSTLSSVSLSRSHR